MTWRQCLQATRGGLVLLASGVLVPVIAELGGKNPVIVSDEADLAGAVGGVTMEAFSFSGQKCSATSRVYVYEAVFEGFTGRLVEATEQLGIGRGEHLDTVINPVIDDGTLERYRTITEQARTEGTIRTGGSVVDDDEFPEGRYVELTVVTDVPHEHDLTREEHFLPFVTIHPVSDLDEGIEKSNDSDYGLCAGIFSEDDEEVDRWFDEVEERWCLIHFLETLDEEYPTNSKTGMATP